MVRKSATKLIQVSVGVLLIGVFTLSFNLYRLSVENKTLKDKLSLENSLHKNELLEILKRYDSVNSMLVGHTKAAMTPFKSATPSNTLLKTIGTGHIKTEVVKNKPLSARIKKEKRKPVKTVAESDTSSATSDASSKYLKALNVSVRGVKIIYSDILETNRSKKIDQIRICYTLGYNETVPKGNQEIFYQIVNPEHMVLGNCSHPDEKFDCDLSCTAKGIVFYENKSTDVCAFVDVDKKKLIRGDYEVNIIHQDRVIGTANFQFR
ncbi:hypothetical protein E6C50_11915 [Flavobacterium supellecticarium]|uniref:Uncharacterized protein n=1 Tax=Flavobacterium supellecticarium TaxID=2565924 RepID=A0A4S3ZUI8_9FLAO|nr:hypothetical protein [Flavobacterium supellecticarium]THF49447.1 hypothetical protein E6C50_11915 [Flavobacterium supellecticarium]